MFKTPEQISNEIKKLTKDLIIEKARHDAQVSFLQREVALVRKQCNHKFECKGISWGGPEEAVCVHCGEVEYF